MLRAGLSREHGAHACSCLRSRGAPRAFPFGGAPGFRRRIRAGGCSQRPQGPRARSRSSGAASCVICRRGGQETASPGGRTRARFVARAATGGRFGRGGQVSPRPTVVSEVAAAPRWPGMTVGAVGGQRWAERERGCLQVRPVVTNH